MTDERLVEPTVARGFTLLELVLALCVITLILALSLPSFIGSGQRSAEAEAKRLASTLRFLYDSSLASKQAQALKIDLSGKALSYTGPEGDRSEEFGRLRSVSTPSKGPMSKGEVIFFFTGLGAAESISFAFDNGEKPDILVSLSHLSGKVTVRTEAEKRPDE